MNWFDVDKAGLAKLVAGRSKAFVLYELLQNAWDQNVRVVDVQISRPNPRTTELRVADDDPEGFANLAHAYTLFAESAKKHDAGKRGRFNLGEKLVLALASSATIETTKGTVIFDGQGRRTSRAKLASGSCVTLTLSMTKADHEELLTAAARVLPPENIQTWVNNVKLGVRPRLATFCETLPTLVADAEGVLRPTFRKTLVHVHEPLLGEVPTLFEMGIPVVETGDRYHVDVQQKVPLNMDRDNVTPSCLRMLRVALFNEVYGRLTEPEELSAPWVREACADANVWPAAVKHALAGRFGADAVAYDPSDPEANKLSTSAGRAVIPGGSLSAGEWANARAAGVLPPAGQVTPSPKPYSPDGVPLSIIPESEWTPGMVQIEAHARMLGLQLLREVIQIQFTCDPQWPFAATYGVTHGLTFNVGRLGYAFFDAGITDELHDLLLHEFGHHYEGDHLSKKYYQALTKLGAKLTRLALDRPELFRVNGDSP
jgi:hypothetical protein